MSTITNNYVRTVDLKWSVWSMDKAYWEEYSPGTWDWMREWFDASLDDGNPESAGLSEGPRIVHTAPRKEIEFGTVEILPGEAHIHFYTEYDEGIRKEAPHIFDTIEAETFDELMHLIDHRALDLLNEMRDKRRKPRCDKRMPQA